MSALRSFIDDLGDMLHTSGYSRDAKLFNDYTGLTLARDEYNHYRQNGLKLRALYPSKKVLASAEPVTSREREAEHFLFETEGGLAFRTSTLTLEEHYAHNACAMIGRMHDHGVTLNPTRLEMLIPETKTVADQKGFMGCIKRDLYVA